MITDQEASCLPEIICSMAVNAHLDYTPVRHSNSTEIKWASKSVGNFSLSVLLHCMKYIIWILLIALSALITGAILPTLDTLSPIDVSG